MRQATNGYSGKLSLKTLVELVIKSQFLLVSGLPTGLWFLETAFRSLKANSFHVHGRRVRIPPAFVALHVATVLALA